MKEVCNHVILSPADVKKIKRSINTLYDGVFQIEDLVHFFQSLDAVLDITTLFNHVPVQSRRAKNKTCFDKIEAYGSEL